MVVREAMEEREGAGKGGREEWRKVGMEEGGREKGGGRETERERENVKKRGKEREEDNMRARCSDIQKMYYVIK